MYDTSPTLSHEARNFNWLLDTFAAQTAGVLEAIAVSSDGLLIGASGHGGSDAADTLAAITSGLVSLAGGAARSYRLGVLDKVIIEMSDGYLVLMSVTAGCSLGVVADRKAQLGTIAFEMTLFADRVGDTVTPALINELKNSVPR